MRSDYIFYFLYIFLGITGCKRHWATLLDTDLDLLLPLNVTGSDSDLDNTFWLRKYLILLLNSINIWFFTPHNILVKEIELGCIWTILLGIITLKNWEIF